ncbi:hypothetical protein N7526_005667 [Penicillium atrosanguineum]|nr:hypothetical protein N7526_005667 [Penicillium atrosanguineum]
MDGHKKRPITYSGESANVARCWTCKARKIKCDENPAGCEACARKGLTCEGYGIKLRWMSSIEGSPSNVGYTGVGRRRIGGGWSINQYWIVFLTDFPDKAEMPYIGSTLPKLIHF